jgi:hypothetical protein
VFLSAHTYANIRSMGDPPFRPISEIERELKRGRLDIAVAIAKDFARNNGRPIPLGLALRFLPLVAMQSPSEFDAWATRWLARWLGETGAPTAEAAAEIASLLAELPREPSVADELAAYSQALATRSPRP